MFSMNMPGMPLDYDIDFSINVKLGTKTISIPSYRMAQTELKKSKEKL